MATKAYKYRTEANVRDSDGTAILSIRPTVNGGSLNTILFTQKLGRPYLHLSRDGRTDGRACDPGKELRRFIKKNRIAVLNVAGSRDSEEPELAAWVKEVLKQALAS
jgi:hypothetical protein